MPRLNTAADLWDSYFSHGCNPVPLYHSPQGWLLCACHLPWPSAGLTPDSFTDKSTEAREQVVIPGSTGPTKPSSPARVSLCWSAMHCSLLNPAARRQVHHPTSKSSLAAFKQWLPVSWCYKPLQGPQSTEEPVFSILLLGAPCWLQLGHNKLVFQWTLYLQWAFPVWLKASRQSLGVSKVTHYLEKISFKLPVGHLSHSFPAGPSQVWVCEADLSFYTPGGVQSRRPYRHYGLNAILPGQE